MRTPPTLGSIHYHTEASLSHGISPFHNSRKGGSDFRFRIRGIAETSGPRTCGSSVREEEQEVQQHVWPERVCVGVVSSTWALWFASRVCLSDMF